MRFEYHQLFWIEEKLFFFHVLVVADIEQLNGVCAIYDKAGINDDSGILVTPSFEVTETTDVVIGFLTSLAKGNSYFKVTELKLILE